MREALSVCCAVVLCVVAGCRPAVELPVLAEIDELRLETSLGVPLSTSDLEGSVHVVDFIFTSCRMACPLMTARMKRLYDELEGVEGVRFLSVTTDPETDTVAVLHDYAQALGVDETRWLFGRAPMEEVRRLSEKEFLLGAGGFPAGHSLKFVLVDERRRIRGYYDSEREEALEALREDLGRLLASR